MSQSRCEKRVTLPDAAQSRKQVNEKLIKIREEMKLDEETSDDDTSFECSPPIRPQQFYADLDAKLDGQNKDDYVKELLQLCHGDFSKLTDYRDRLAERAQSNPKCPQTRLVNRRNSTTGTKEVKCANDCYVLYAYNHGVHDRSILDIFTSSQTQCENDDIIENNEDKKQFVSPDLLAMITKLQIDMEDVKKRQARDSIIIDSLRLDVNNMLTLFRMIHGTLNSVLARVGSIANVVSHSNLQRDCDRMETSLTTAQNLLARKDATQEHDTNNTVTISAHPAPAPVSCEKPAPMTFAGVVASPARTPTASNMIPDQNADSTNSTEPTNRDRASDQINTKRPSHNNQNTCDNHSHTSGFRAARRKHVVSYYIGNIDNDVTKQEIYDYMKASDVVPSFINIYYGKNGAAAKINVHAGDEYRINCEQFWPDKILVRKWVSKQEWESEKPNQRPPRFNRYRRWRQHTNRRNDQDYYDAYCQRTSAYDDENHWSDRQYDDKYTESYTHHYDSDDFNRDDQRKGDNRY